MNNLNEPYLGVAAHTGSDIDIPQEIWSLKKSIKLTAEWVEAHQDTKYPTKSLSKSAKLNCIADKDAGAYMASTHEHSSTPPVFPTTAATFTVQGIVITSKLKEVL
eukprot:11896552-Ditylum_brightwellii.AAC.1